MNSFELEGFLRGRCLPGDMKVNETNAEYLVRKFAEAEAKCAALAAENAGLKAIVSGINNELYGQGFMVSGWHLNGALEPLDNWFTDNGWGEPETPVTDAFLAEVRNEAGARAVELFAQTLGSPYAVRDEKCYEDGFTRAIEIVRGAQAPRFAAQLRKGVQNRWKNHARFQ